MQVVVIFVETAGLVSVSRVPLTLCSQQGPSRRCVTAHFLSDAFSSSTHISSLDLWGCVKTLNLPCDFVGVIRAISWIAFLAATE
jgi:hypothetical protein